MGQPKPKYKALLTPAQQQAQQMLASYIAGGPSAQPKYEGDFKLLPDDFMASLLKPAGSEPGTSAIPGLSPEAYDIIMEMARTGEPVDQTTAFMAERKAGETSAARAVEAGLATGQKFGSKYGSAAVGSAMAQGAEVQGKVDVNILREAAAAQEAAKGRKLQAASFLMQGAQYATILKVDSAKLYMAASQFEKTGNYEEWKRQFPDVYQIANAMFQNKLDWVAEQKKDWVGPALTAIAGIVATIATGGAAAPVALGAVAASLNSSSTAGSVGNAAASNPTQGGYISGNPFGS